MSEEKNVETVLEETPAKKKTDYEKLRFFLSLISTSCLVIITAVVIILALDIKGKIQNIYDSAMVSLVKMETVTQEIQNANLGGTVGEIRNLAGQATGDLATTMEKVDSIDIDGLNDSIRRLDGTITELDSAVSSLNGVIPGGQ